MDLPFIEKQTNFNRMASSDESGDGVAPLQGDTSILRWNEFSDLRGTQRKSYALQSISTKTRFHF